ncbi:MAG: UDP-3-O-(3-hydroxymyristoyl) N-acetylglucosamine deacetylase [Syntrophorhabdaceae bacterium PtaU1.Bin034]|jgi:UDP-3-O-[3-hydroxymyristoyl] N-acetylglucosamine deacetylase|nr:MAG: UDP-3-O-(3-hydroxymyristoyl) N-acetylglucosamine deacetylase [Syntrophorhabdaceae bacterium PtaU1.Bin034]
MTKVLIIDDEKSILESLSSVLQDEGFTVSTAKDGKEGLNIFEKEKPKVVLLDVWMPEMDGLEVLRQVRERGPDAVVIVISGHGTISTAVEAVKMGATDFLEKPLSIDKVLEVISRGLAGRTNGKEKTGDDVRFEIAKGPQTCRQKTIGKSIVVYGMGLFSGIKTGMILLPMPAGTGIIFEQVPEGERIPAFIDYAYSSGNASSIKGKNCTIRTIEHLLATCHMYGITNLLVKISDEVPIFDGSAQEICAKIEEAGIIEQKQGIEPLVITEKVTLRNLPGGKFLSIEPAAAFEIDYTLDQPVPIGIQKYLFKGGRDAFVRDIAPARTFGSIKDFEKLEKAGLAAGRVSSVISNVILLNNDQVINTELRFKDEFVRHKILDLIGDLYLIARPVVGKVIARQTGHLENIALVKELRRTFSS